MKEVGRRQSEGECFVCALLPYSMGKSKIFVAVEIDVPTAHCMSHVAMCNTRGQFMGRDASLIRANEKDYPDEDRFVQDINTRNRVHTKNHVIRYENPEVKGSGIRWEINSRLNVQGKTAEEAQIWKNRGQMQIWGSVVSPDGWEEGVVICRAWMVLGACQEAIENSQRLCKPLWPKLVKLLTWVEDRGGPLQIVPLENRKLCFRSNGTRKMGENQNCGRIYEAPGMSQGTTVLMDHYWACGSKAYIRLQRNWGGICTLVNIHIAALVIPKNELNLDSFPKADAHLRKRRSVELMSRMKRENYFSAKSEDAFYAIPYEHRLFSLTSSVFTTILLPHIQVGANTKWLLIRRWESVQTINTTIKGFNAIIEELRAVRLMTLQNIYVLDMITAMDGGVCANIGESCCTFIPSHDEENGTLTEAISMLTTLKNQMIDKTDEVEDDSWFGNLFSWVPQWMADIFKFLGALLAMVLLGICVIKRIIRQCQKTAKKAIWMKIMVDVEPCWKRRDLTDEEIKDFVKASEFSPEGTKFTYPKKRRGMKANGFTAVQMDNAS
ncbi:uncharacterized protein [Ambystoma mexicanum]|uniref:uncharacterized protein n=1 Tax=Ambystoma mexicanum TaxID=8296 RepID=UPI0037E79993